MALTTTANVLSSGALQKQVNSVAIAEYRTNSYFKQFGATAQKKKGANSYSWYSVNDNDTTVAGATITEHNLMEHIETSGLGRAIEARHHNVKYNVYQCYTVIICMYGSY